MSDYGKCPRCGANGISRQRRLDGNDMCSNGHTYPSSTAIHPKPEYTHCAWLDGVPILKDGKQMTIEEILLELRS